MHHGERKLNRNYALLPDSLCRCRFGVSPLVPFQNAGLPELRKYRFFGEKSNGEPCIVQGFCVNIGLDDCAVVAEGNSV